MKQIETEIVLIAIVKCFHCLGGVQTVLVKTKFIRV